MVQGDLGAPGQAGDTNEVLLGHRDSILGRLALLGIAGAIITAISGFLGYVPGLGFLGSIKEDYIPMAPSTAISFLLLSGILLSYSRFPRQRQYWKFAVIISFGVALFGLLEVVGPLVDRDLNFEDALVPSAGKLGDIPVARMSPSTGAVFFIAGLATASLYLKEREGLKVWNLRHWAGSLGCLVVLGSAIVMLAYLHGTPLLYDMGAIVPMAITTALAFLLLGIALVAVSDYNSVPLRFVTGATTEAKLLRYFLPLSVAAVLIGSLVILPAPIFSQVNSAFISAASVVLVMVVTGILARWVASSVGGSIDRAEAERKQTEEALKEKERVLRESQEVARIGSYILDIPSGIWKSSKVLDEIFGIDEDFDRSIEGWVSLIHPEWRQIMADYLAQDVLEKRGRFDKEYKIIRQNDQAERWVHGMGELELDAEGNPVKMIGTIQDITEHMQAEKALRESEARFRALFETSPDGVLITQKSHLIYANPAFQHIFGISKMENYMGQPSAAFIAPIDQERVLSMALGREAGEERPTTYEFTGMREDGTEFPVEVTAARFEHEGRPATMAILRDVSNRKAMEERLMLTGRLAAIGQLAAGVAHEVNTPLTNISLVADNLMETTTDEAAKVSAKQVIEQVVFAAHIVKDLLNFARPSSPKVEELDMHHLLESSLNQLETPGWLKLDRRLAEELPPLRGDRVQLQEVFTNLIRNAVYAMAGQGKGTLTLETLRLDSQVEVTLRDTGQGIPAEDLEHIFEPFFTTKPTGQGTGLGLSLVQRFVHDHGGNITVKSQPGLGTSITVTLPLDLDIRSNETPRL